MNENQLIEAALGFRRWAVAGATDKPDRYGYKVFKLLRDRGYEVRPIHPKLAEIEGAACFASISDLPEPPEVVCLVVNPSIGEGIVDEAVRLGAKFLWAQPGAQSRAIDEKAGRAGVRVVNDCVLVQLGNRPESRF